MNNYPFYNPSFQNQYYPQSYNNQLPKTSVKKVTGTEGANMFPMAPDSSDILLDCKLSMLATHPQPLRS